jgi:hypothetical protein
VLQKALSVVLDEPSEEMWATIRKIYSSAKQECDEAVEKVLTGTFFDALI